MSTEEHGSEPPEPGRPQASTTAVDESAGVPPPPPVEPGQIGAPDAPARLEAPAASPALPTGEPDGADATLSGTATGIPDPVDPVGSVDVAPGEADEIGGATGSGAGRTSPPPRGSDRFLNRELSWLEFNARVLALAENPTTPLLERAKFVAICSQNLDEFFQVRVAGLKDQVAAGITSPAPDGRTPLEQLAEIRERVLELVDRQEHVFLDDIVPALADAGVRFAGWDDLDQADRDLPHPRVPDAHLPGAHTLGG